MRAIRLRYESIDRVRFTRTFKTIEGAARFAHKWVGTSPELALNYAISGDGIGKLIVVWGATLTELFPDVDTSWMTEERNG